MQIFKHIVHLQKTIAAQRASGKQIGFVPTMGALHQGHIALISQAVQETDYVVCSIFVNPTQFNDATDLVKYPRTIAADLAKLYEANCSAVLLPEVHEIYPDPLPELPLLDFGNLTKVLEGAYRPGHFDGVVQVVHRLLDIVRPDKLYMGQKDYQQQAIIGHMLEQITSKIQLITCPTVREKDGLAMSSRNTRLTDQQRSIAPTIFATLSEIADKIDTVSIPKLEAVAKQALTNAGFIVDYCSIVDGKNLQPIQSFADTESVVVAVAAYLGEIRLIDNLILKDEKLLSC